MQTLAPTALRFLGNLPLESEMAPAPVSKVRRDRLFLETLRANLHASARHAALGHNGSGFRDCSSPACTEAAKMLPELDPVHFATTDAELDMILGQVLADLEREGTPFLAPLPS